MKISKKNFDERLGVWTIVCPLCKTVLASDPEESELPDYRICTCDRNGNKIQAYELFDRDGETWIRRNKYPRFIGRITMGAMSDIENVELIDDCDDVKKLASVMRKAGLFLKRYKYKYGR